MQQTVHIRVAALFLPLNSRLNGLWAHYLMKTKGRIVRGKCVNRLRKTDAKKLPMGLDSVIIGWKSRILHAGGLLLPILLKS